MGNDRSQSSKHGSSLCHHCQSLDLATISQLKLAHENLSDTIRDRKRKHTWKIEWQDSEEADLQCTLCRILRMYGNRLGAHSARTFFKCERVENPVLFEVYYHTTTLLLPHLKDKQTKDSNYGIYGRVIDPGRVNYNLILRWMKSCNDNHSAACLSQFGTPMPAFKVIDSTTRRIVTAPEGCKYLALSYLWGHQSTTKEQQHFSQGKLDDHVPRVVKDAIEVAHELEIGYVWVDKYCLDQSDKPEKQKLIRQMDQIYHDATITIIAAAGNDAEYGLPGVSNVSRNEQMSIDIGNRKYLVFPDSTREVRQSIWATRAWTYQEALLSRRRLVFTREQVYFQCMKMHCWEGLRAPSTALRRMRYYQCFPEDGIGKYLFFFPQKYKIIRTHNSSWITLK